MKRLVTAIAITASLAALAAVATHQYRQSSTDPHQSDLLSKLHIVEQTLSATKQDLLGYTTFTQNLEVTKKAISDRAKFLAATIDRNYVHVEHINRSALGIKSDATIILNYAVEYSVGYDLSPGSFTVAADATGITVTLNKPELVSSPAIGAISHEIPGKGLLIDGVLSATLQTPRNRAHAARARGQSSFWRVLGRARRAARPCRCATQSGGASASLAAAASAWASASV